MSTRLALTEPADPADSTVAWAIVVRLAGVTAVMTATFALALQWFVGLGAVPLVVLSAVVALAVGSRLPAASPRFLQPLDPE
jgi:hypothetical protein